MMGVVSPHNCIYPLSAKETHAVDDYIMETLKQRYIFPSTSPTLAGFLLEKKEGGLIDLLRPLIIRDLTKSQSNATTLSQDLHEAGFVSVWVWKK